MGYYHYMVLFLFYFLHFISISYQAIPSALLTNGGENRTTGGRYKRGTPSRRAGLWSQGIVPYRKDSVTEDKQVSDKFDMAVKYIEALSCVKFVPVKDFADVRALNLGQATILSIIMDKHSCWSYVGTSRKTKNPQNRIQKLGLARQCGRAFATPVHELLHTLGMKHEQRRPERDNYLSYHEYHVYKGCRFQYKQLDPKYLDLSVPYDISSLMHYPGNGCSYEPFNENKYVMYPRAAFLNYNRYFAGNFGGSARGWKNPMSHRDIQSLNKLYNCTDHCISALPCQNGGFLNKDCLCQCPRFYIGLQCETFNESINSKDCSTPWTINAVPGETGTLTPPGSEGKRFFFKRTCVWRIRAPPGGRIRIAFNEMNIDHDKRHGDYSNGDGYCKTDKLTIYLYGSAVDVLPVPFCDWSYGPDMRAKYLNKKNPIWSYSDSEEIVVHWKSSTLWRYWTRPNMKEHRPDRAVTSGWSLIYQAISQDEVPKYGSKNEERQLDNLATEEDLATRDVDVMEKAY